MNVYASEQLGTETLPLDDAVMSNPQPLWRAIGREITGKVMFGAPTCAAVVGMHLIEPGTWPEVGAATGAFVLSCGVVAAKRYAENPKSQNTDFK